MLNSTNEAKIEALLFYMAEPAKVKKMMDILHLSSEEIQAALIALERSLQGRGVNLVRSEDEVVLATAPELSVLIESVKKEELSKDLGRAGVETLGIIVYKGPISRSEIDYIRGVNSTYIVRHLTVRGLVERVQNPSDMRGYLYKPSLDLLKYLGVSKVSDMPEYENFKAEMESAMSESDSLDQIEKDA